jgi:hypothetical protein
MKKRIATASIHAILVLTGSIFAQTSTPLSAVSSFYKYDRSHSQIFSKAAIESRKKWFTPDLYQLFQNELRREKVYLKKNPTDKPYFGDGLPFQPIDETCGPGGKGRHKALTFRAGDRTAMNASVQAIFAFPRPCKDPDTTIYTIRLIKTRRAWLIDDVQYEGDRSLVADLKRKDY